MQNGQNGTQVNGEQEATNQYPNAYINQLKLTRVTLLRGSWTQEGILALQRIGGNKAAKKEGCPKTAYVLGEYNLAQVRGALAKAPVSVESVGHLYATDTMPPNIYADVVIGSKVNPGRLYQEPPVQIRN